LDEVISRYILVTFHHSKTYFPKLPFSLLKTLAASQHESNTLLIAYIYKKLGLLHYNYYDSAMSRDQYGEKLSQELSKKFEKNQEDIYELLKDKQEQAIKRAKKLKKF
jgi:hypothetical protein